MSKLPLIASLENTLKEQSWGLVTFDYNIDNWEPGLGIICNLAINCDTGRHSQSLRCFFEMFAILIIFTLLSVAGSRAPDHLERDERTWRKAKNKKANNYSSMQATIMLEWWCRWYCTIISNVSLFYAKNRNVTFETQKLHWQIFKDSKHLTAFTFNFS